MGNRIYRIKVFVPEAGESLEYLVQRRMFWIWWPTISWASEARARRYIEGMSAKLPPVRYLYP